MGRSILIGLLWRFGGRRRIVMKVLMLAWEYPPDHVGGLGRHVCHLSESMVRQGVGVTVLTRGIPGKPLVREQSGVEVVSAVPYDLHPPSFTTWAAQFNVSLMEIACRLLRKKSFQIIHAHDWIVAYAARALKHSAKSPLIATIHATESGRQKGLHTPMQHHISQTEWWLCYEAWKVVACSRYMKDEVKRLFSVPDDKINVIPNGICDSWFEIEKKEEMNPLLLYVGRLVPEKGAHVLVEAMNEVLFHFPSARLVLAGQGPMEMHLRNLVFQCGLTRAVEFAGHLGDKQLKDLYSRAWIAVFPSSYEPFGIVALEAMASGTPCIVGDSGGLREIVDDGVTGCKSKPDNPADLARILVSLISDEPKRRRLAEDAKKMARRDYSWSDVAKSTVSMYEEVLKGLSKRSLITANTQEKPTSLHGSLKLESAGSGGHVEENGVGA